MPVVSNQVSCNNSKISISGINPLKKKRKKTRSASDVFKKTSNPSSKFISTAKNDQWTPQSGTFLQQCSINKYIVIKQYTHFSERQKKWQKEITSKVFFFPLFLFAVRLTLILAPQYYRYKKWSTKKYKFFSFLLFFFLFDILYTLN